MTSSIQQNSRLIPLLAALLIILQLIQPYRGWMILLIGLGGAWVFSYFWARSLMKHLHLSREMRFGWAQVGDLLEERFTIENTGWAPALWVEIIDYSTLPDHHINWATGVEAHSSTQWHTQGTCSRRGVFTLGPTSLKSSLLLLISGQSATFFFPLFTLPHAPAITGKMKPIKSVNK